MSLKLYFDLMSQPSRALYILLKKCKTNFSPVLIDLRKGEHFSDEYTTINKFQRVPCIDHNGFVLTESIAILRYLARENLLSESLYPAESKMQARVDEFLEWHHIGLRLHLSLYFRVKYMDPILAGEDPDPVRIAPYEKRMMAALEVLETKWLGQGNTFLTGNEATVADLLGTCELEQPRMAGYDPKEKFPNIAAWMANVRNYFNPHYDEAHIILNKVVKKYHAKFSNQQSKL